MNLFVLFLCSLPIVILVASYFCVKTLKGRAFNREVLDAHEKCLGIDGKLQKGHARFIPPEGEEDLYVEMVRRGWMVGTPLGGYMLKVLKENGEALWGEIPRDCVSVSEENYKDDNGVLASDLVDGCWVPRIIEKNNKPVKVNQGLAGQTQEHTKIQETQ